MESDFLLAWLKGFGVVLIPLTVLWLVSIKIKNVSIIDAFWGTGFVIVSLTYAILTDLSSKSVLVLSLVVIWGLRLSVHLLIRNWGKAEDYRYRQFRADYGPKRYWWFSFFQVFLLQGVLLWIISLPILAYMYFPKPAEFRVVEMAAVILWVIGFLFETVGDYQLVKFKSNPANKGKLMTSGLWKYTRHPNYFGDAAVWWAFGLFGIASGANWTVVSPFLMTWLLLKVSGVAMLERTLIKAKPGYEAYVRRTSAFFPRPPKDD